METKFNENVVFVIAQFCFILGQFYFNFNCWQAVPHRFHINQFQFLRCFYIKIPTNRLNNVCIGWIIFFTDFEKKYCTYLIIFKLNEHWKILDILLFEVFFSDLFITDPVNIPSPYFFSKFPKYLCKTF